MQPKLFWLFEKRRVHPETKHLFRRHLCPCAESKRCFARGRSTYFCLNLGRSVFLQLLAHTWPNRDNHMAAFVTAGSNCNRYGPYHLPELPALKAMEPTSCNSHTSNF